MSIKVIANKATPKQRKQFEDWLWKQCHWAGIKARLGLIPFKELPVMLRRVEARMMRDEK